MIYIAALSSISDELYQAATIDGASSFQTMIHISIPLIAPAFMINLILAIIGGFKQFDQIFSMTGGGPGNLTETLSLLIYNKAYLGSDYGYASAVSFVFLLIVLAIAFFIIRLFKREG
jgi:ABC-type sugar transport system permease subunit